LLPVKPELEDNSDKLHFLMVLNVVIKKYHKQISPSLQIVKNSSVKALMADCVECEGIMVTPLY